MLSRELHWRFGLLSLVLGCAATVFAAPAPSAKDLMVRLGEGPIPLEGPWLFHPGDDIEWAQPEFGDSDWQSLSANRTWATQGHFKYTGYAWYRLHVQFQQEGYQFTNVALLIPHVDDAYELYWNGALVARSGKFPPHPLWRECGQPPQTFGLGPVQQGVLALRVWKAPLFSDDSGLRGGFERAPLAGAPPVIALQKARMDYAWLRSRQLYFGVNTLYGIVGLLTLFAWMRNPRQWQLFWMAGFAITRIVEMIFYQLQLPWPLTVANALWQPFSAFRSVSLWFLLLWLLQLRQDHRVVRLARICAWTAMTTDTVDGFLTMQIWRPGWQQPVQIADGVLTAVYTATLMLPLVLVAIAVTCRGGLNKTRWVVAICAFVAGMVDVIRNAVPQGSRFTHWTFGNLFDAPLFTWNGNSVSIVMVTSTLVLLTSAYAVFRGFEENRRRQLVLDQELENARALQQVLIPAELPGVPGFRVSSAYCPALEVGGDFFQIIPLKDHRGSTLIVVGDVSGKGLSAAMSVSFIVGALHALVETISRPAALLAELNERLLGRLQNGFITCLALGLEPDGRCRVAGAGHPSPFVDGREIQIDSGLPLGIVPGVVYGEVEFVLLPGQTCRLYTDGLTEARDKTGEMFGEDRLAKLFAAAPTALKVAEAAILFGQNDDVTVVDITRLKEEVTTAQTADSDAVRIAAIPSTQTPAATIG